jgi:hypothetical protein
LDRLGNRLTKILAEIRKLQPPQNEQRLAGYVALSLTGNPNRNSDLAASEERGTP